MTTRRRFIRGAAALAALGPPLLSESIRRAAAIPAASPTGTIQDVEHVVIFMQENRSFDHYYGTYQGIRGFGDPRPAPLYGDGSRERPTTIWHQPHGKHADGHILPYALHPQPPERAACFTGLPHDWASGHDAVNRGRGDRWALAKSPPTMAYYQGADIPFHFALADAFTICDAYHSSLVGPTHPNRMFLWSGTNGQHDRADGPRIDNSGKPHQFAWTTYPERLQQAGISWQLYQNARENNGRDQFGATNAGLNALQWFAPYDPKQFPDSPLVARGNSVRTLDDLRRDVQEGRLAQVTYIIPPGGCCEHPQFPPAYGAVYMSHLLDALTTNPEVWSRTVLLIMYDENDGFFDHLPPPMPPAPHGVAGGSTVDATDELYKDGRPFGLGARVPMTIVSPWSRGGFVCSQVFDHTSVIRFLEARFGVPEPNISAWRRAVCGDLTTAFDFRAPSLAAATLPDTNGFIANPPDIKAVALPTVPGTQALPSQRVGTRPARPSPYVLQADASVDAAHHSVTLAFANRGTAGAVFQVFPGQPAGDPRFFTVEAGKELSDPFVLPGEDDPYELTILGPDGFFRCFRGNLATATPEIGAAYDAAHQVITLSLRNPGTAACELSVRRNAYGAPEPRRHVIAAGATSEDRWDLAASQGWYDLTVTAVGMSTFVRRYAGHLASGPSTTDPAMGAVIPAAPYDPIAP